MIQYQIVMDTNTLAAALRSKRGASYKLLSLIDSGKFQLNISVPLVFEYEDVVKGDSHITAVLSEAEIDNILDYLCAVANRRKIFFLWRPFLKDPKDDFLLELAVEAQCSHIITYNKMDFAGIGLFGIKALTAHEFLQLLGELP
ncbi:putative toxin-antitoxin system toxin component, PIN family [candidate division KSB1 bacterium]|nr:putative toxin-antitoxin system toxin component, PIN family [candidate division KSB1 bacterium]